jgi:hypothetical protein
MVLKEIILLVYIRTEEGDLVMTVTGRYVEKFLII